MELEKIRRLSIIGLLKNWGCIPAKQGTRESFFRSPLREGDKNPSFHVTEKQTPKGKDIWHDHGLGRDGNIIDLVKEKYTCGFQDALRVLDFSRALRPQAPASLQTAADDQEKTRA